MIARFQFQRPGPGPGDQFPSDLRGLGHDRDLLRLRVLPADQDIGLSLFQESVTAFQSLPVRLIEFKRQSGAALDPVIETPGSRHGKQDGYARFFQHERAVLADPSQGTVFRHPHRKRDGIAPDIFIDTVDRIHLIGSGREPDFV